MGMNFPGKNELIISEKALCMALEDALNATRKEGEDFVHVESIARDYGIGPLKLSITTDKQESNVTALGVAA